MSEKNTCIRYLKNHIYPVNKLHPVKEIWKKKVLGASTEITNLNSNFQVQSSNWEIRSWFFWSSGGKYLFKAGQWLLIQLNHSHFVWISFVQSQTVSILHTPSWAIILVTFEVHLFLNVPTCSPCFHIILIETKNGKILR